MELLTKEINNDFAEISLQTEHILKKYYTKDLNILSEHQDRLIKEMDEARKATPLNFIDRDIIIELFHLNTIRLHEMKIQGILK